MPVTHLVKSGLSCEKRVEKHKLLIQFQSIEKFLSIRVIFNGENTFILYIQWTDIFIHLSCSNTTTDII